MKLEITILDVVAYTSVLRYFAKEASSTKETDKALIHTALLPHLSTLVLTFSFRN
jgi:hypothetical protein